MHDDIGRLQRRDGAHGEQPGIAGAGADQDDAPALRRIEKRCHSAGMCDGTPRRTTDASLGAR